eukprot:TRINITY_DN6247_c0_g4_i1.p1 TRINITY_DN6247_c0_g4~~TRINITY_DN6247_c0_g4_i1.p1  ORF type:complete len:451 (+),score=98.71 TRINITY_DN6247_c0_g4_i1:44-1396(+)
MSAARLIVPSNALDGCTSPCMSAMTPPSIPLNSSLNGSMKSPDNRTLSGRDFVARSNSFTEPHRMSPLSLPSPSELFPDDGAMQELERKDREWLQYRRAQRVKEELEDLHAYQVRLDARKKTAYLAQHPPVLSSTRPLISEQDRKSFRILVGIDKKKAKEHAAGLVYHTYQNSQNGNQIHLFNCYTKNSSKRQEETLAHLEAIKKQLQTYSDGTNVTTASSHVTKDKCAAIIDYSVKEKIDLIVLGMKQEEKGFFARKVSPGVIDTLPDGKAILLVPPPDETTMNLAMKDVKRNIMFCYDGTPHCERALTYLAHVLRPQDEVTVCNVVTPPPKLVVVAQSDDHASLQPNSFYDAVLSQRVSSSEALLAKVKAELSNTIEIPDANIKTELRVLEPGKHGISDIILEIAKKLNSSMIILGSRGIDGWQKVMQGAVTQPILETATRRSIMIVR